MNNRALVLQTETDKFIAQSQIEMAERNLSILRVLSNVLSIGGVEIYTVINSLASAIREKRFNSVVSIVYLTVALGLTFKIKFLQNCKAPISKRLLTFCAR